MPARYKGRSSPWEVRLTLEPGLWERFKKDRLMMWPGPREVSKVWVAVQEACLYSTWVQYGVVEFENTHTLFVGPYPVLR